MSVYSKVLVRAAIFFSLVTAAMMLSKPAPVEAFVDCCQTCADELQQCLNNCTTTLCRGECERAESRCIEICPACE